MISESLIHHGATDDHAGSVEFYDSVIAPYKGQVEAWYVDHKTLFIYFAVFFVTVWIVLFSGSNLVWQVFKGLPVPPDELKGPLNYPVAML